MIDLTKFKEHTSGTWRLRKVIDDSGDYTIARYDVMATYPWGDKGICYSIENPYDAMLFAAGPDLIAEIEVLRERVNYLEIMLKKAASVLEEGV